METALQQFSVLPSTKEQRQSFIKMAVEEITSGNIDAIKADAIIKEEADNIEAIRNHNEEKSAVPYST